MRLPGRGIALVVSCGHRRGRGFAPSPICTIMLRPSTGAAASHLSPIWVIMRLPGRGIALVVSCGHRRGRGFAPSPICTIMLRPSTGAAASHLSPIWVIMRTTRARDRPGSRLWPSTGAAASHLFGRSPPEVSTSGGLPLSRWRAVGWANAIRLELSVPRVKRR